MTAHQLGWCLGCRYAATQGHNINPFVPAAHLVAGVGLCGDCALGVISTVLTPATVTALLNVTGRARPPHQGQ